MGWLNTDDYTVLELVLFAVGCFGWVIAYVEILRKIRKYRFVEIPAAAVVANIAWEFVWGFLYTTNMGMLFAWGYRIWFFLDVFIVYCLYRYGAKQVDTPEIKRFFAPIVTFGIVAWGVAIYFFIGDGYDTEYGAISGYILNAMMSALYIVLILQRANNLEAFSLVVAWSKGLGTAILTVFNVMVRGDDSLLMMLCFATLVLDAAYVIVFYALRRQQAAVAKAA